ncbi:KptA family-domain-containing protein [Phellopilus nigrolimitatus]|nr:KptA family-domain-containing protein [Phellopilus nigrolimitatus]
MRTCIFRRRLFSIASSSSLLIVPPATARYASQQAGFDYWDHKLRRMERIEEKRLSIQQEQEHANSALRGKPPARSSYKKMKLRGHPRDEEDVRISKTLSWVLRHGAKSAGLHMRSDGYVRVSDLLAIPRLRSVDFPTLERLVQTDSKERYHLLFESQETGDPWWIRANQGHSIKDVDLQFQEITDVGQIPMAVHGTNLLAWKAIEKEGLSPMKRNFIHLAQHVSHIKGLEANAGLRENSQVLIYVDLESAKRDGVVFYLSSNGVVLTKYFMRVTDAYDTPLCGWSGVRSLGNVSEKKIHVRTGKSRQREGRDKLDKRKTTVAEPDGVRMAEIDEVSEAISNVELKEST